MASDDSSYDGEDPYDRYIFSKCLIKNIFIFIFRLGDSLRTTYSNSASLAFAALVEESEEEEEEGKQELEEEAEENRFENQFDEIPLERPESPAPPREGEENFDYSSAAPLSGMSDFEARYVRMHVCTINSIVFFCTV